MKKLTLMKAALFMVAGSVFAATDQASDEIDRMIPIFSRLGLSEIQAKSVARHYVLDPDGQCAAIAARAIRGSKASQFALQAFPDSCTWKTKAENAKIEEQKSKEKSAETKATEKNINGNQQAAKPVVAERKIPSESEKREANKKAQAYYAGLISKYRARIHYESPRGREIVETFNIDCHYPNGRYVPLMHILVGTIDSTEKMGIKRNTYVENRGGNVRIIEVDTFQKGGDTSKISFTINEWGEIQAFNLPRFALAQTCTNDSDPGRELFVDPDAR